MSVRSASLSNMLVMSYSVIASFDAQLCRIRTLMRNDGRVGSGIVADEVCEDVLARQDSFEADFTNKLARLIHPRQQEWAGKRDWQRKMLWK